MSNITLETRGGRLPSKRFDIFSWLARAIDGCDFEFMKEVVRIDNECNPLHVAAARGSHESVEFLIQSGFSVDSTLKLEYPEPGFTPLHFAAQRNHLECARVLLKHGASVSSKIEGISDPIHLAVFYGHEDMIALLLDNGANVNARFNNYFFEQTKDYLGEINVLGEKIHETLWRDHNLPLIHYTILRQFRSTTEMFIIHYGVDVDIKTSLGKTTLMQTVEIDECAFIEYLVERRNANVNHKDNSGKSVIHYTMLNANRLKSKYSKPEYTHRSIKKRILTFLIDNGADLNSQYPEDGSNYNTVIHYMIRYGYHEGLDYLLYYGNLHPDKIDLNSAHLAKLNYQDLTSDIVGDAIYIRHLSKTFEKITYSLVAYAITRQMCNLDFDNNLILKSPIHEWITHEEYAKEINKCTDNINDELNILKTVTIGDSDITLHYLLFCEFNELVRLMSNKRLNIFDFNNHELLKESNIFYFYWPIRHRLIQADNKNLNIKKSTELLTNWFSKHLPMDCCETVVNHLDDPTLSKLSCLIDIDKSDM